MDQNKGNVCIYGRQRKTRERKEERKKGKGRLVFLDFAFLFCSFLSRLSLSLSLFSRLVLLLNFTLDIPPSLYIPSVTPSFICIM